MYIRIIEHVLGSASKKFMKFEILCPSSKSNICQFMKFEFVVENITNHWGLQKPPGSQTLSQVVPSGVDA